MPEQDGWGQQIVAFSFASALGRAGYIANFNPQIPPVWDITPPQKFIPKKAQGAIS